MSGMFRDVRHCPCHPRTEGLLLFDRDAALADLDLDVAGTLPILVDLIAESHGNDGERANAELQEVADHSGVLLLRQALSEPRHRSVQMR
jgi:hypothetical protein